MLLLGELWIDMSSIKPFRPRQLNVSFFLLANGIPPHGITLNALAMSGSILFTTVHTQDFQDEVGDRAMGRKTLIIQIGPMLSRISILFFVLLWSWYLPIAWGVPTLFRAYFVGLGVYLAGRVITSCSVLDDEYNFRLYNVGD